ncbi:MAG: hypothetical protein J6K32_10750 [Clostridia bacterium]|nr:hypothetical protein [Clostridia bacterium]
MKRIVLFLILLALAAMPACGAARRIDMPTAALAFDYPDSWLVVSPQLAKVYEPLLAARGIDAQVLSEDLARQGVQSRAYNEDFTQRLSIITLEDDLAADIFDIASVTDEQRRTIRSRAENGRCFETTGYRVQDVEWQKEKGVYWLYIHYTITKSDQLIGRGVRYMTVRSGRYVILDWQRDVGRFTNRELSAFRGRLADLEITRELEAPVRTVQLDAVIPTETITSELEITGTATGGATLVASIPDGAAMRTISVGQANKNGSFTLIVPLEDEGEYEITLTASREGMNETSVTGVVAYSAKRLPVTIEGVTEGEVTVVAQSETILSGSTLAGVQMQLVSPYGLTKKRSQNDGSFSFSLSTKDEGEYDYTLILDKSGFEQRRIRFTLQRVMTDQQAREQVKDGAEKISYKNLQKARAEDAGKTMVIYGPVTEMSEGGGMYYLRMQYNKDAEGKWYNEIVIVSAEEMGVKVGDMATVVATVAGVYEEQDSKGNDIIVPRFDLLFVDKVE